MSQQSTTNKSAADQAKREQEELILKSRMHEIGFKLLVLSGKGGVGKSTVAANLAVALAMRGKNVGLLDVDVHGPSIPKLMGLEGRPIGSDGVSMIPIQLHENLKVMSIGFLLRSDADAVIWRGPLKYHVIRQFLKDVAWGHLDYLVIDSPPGTGDEPLSVAQLVGSPAAAVIVTTPQDLAVSDVRRCASFCNSLAMPIAGIVENMSGFVCPKCGAQINLFKTGGGQALANEMDVPFLGGIPFDPNIVISGDTGTPFVESSTSTQCSKTFGEVVDCIVAQRERHNEADGGQERAKETNHMRIAIPLAGGRLSSHFGHCEEFAIIEIKKNTKEVFGTSKHGAPPHEPGALPRWLHKLGANVIIAAGMGQRAQQLFAEQGITVIVGVSANPPERLVAAYLDGRLPTGENICDH